MQRKTKCKFLASILCIMLIVAMALCTVGCNKKDGEKETLGTGQESGNNANESNGNADVQENADGTDVQGQVTELGEGKLSFQFSVTDKDGNETKYLIHTDKTVVGDALKDHALIEGEEGAFGLYVKKVNGITADYDIDQTFWAFYVDGEMAMSGVDVTDITDGAEYAFKVEK